MKRSNSRHIYKTTRNAINEAKKIMRKMTYEELATKENYRKIIEEVYIKYKDEELSMQSITYFDKLNEYAIRIRDQKFWELCNESKKYEMYLQ